MAIRESAIVQTAAAVLCALLLATPAVAQIEFTPATDFPRPELPTVPEDAPVLLEADTLTYDSRTDTVTATGNATVYYGTYTVFADRIVYDRGNDTVTAFGNVLITEEKGTLVEAEEIVLHNELREGFIYSVTAVLSNDARIGAARGQRIGGTVTEFDQAVYTACKPCEEHPERPLTWQLKAEKVRHDQAEKIIEYRNVTLELFGVPVVYFPYFQHPDPTVKRKSGFLTPSFRVSDFYEFGVRVPYFFALAPQYDLTFAPLITTRQGPLFDFEWRHKPNNSGQYTIRPTFIWQADPALTPPGNEVFRGSIETTGQFALNERWTFGWDATFVTDDTYLERYNIKSDTDLVSDVYLTGLSERNYLTIHGYAFEGLLASDIGSMTPYIHPAIDYNYIFDDPVLGGELGLDTEVVSLTRDVGTDSTRISSDLHWQRSFIGDMGQVVTPFASLRGDVYFTDNLPDPTVPGGIRGPDTVGRVQPMAGVEVSWPHARYDELGTHVIEPIAQFIIRANEMGMADIPNENALSFNYEIANLFEWDKFTDTDRYEGGTRANVGVRYTLSDVYGGTTVAALGQSYQVAGANPFAPTSGLATDSSDLVSSVSYLAPSNIVRLAWRGRFDNSSLTPRVNEISVATNHSGLEFEGAYAYVSAAANQLAPTTSEEIAARATYELFRNWSVHGGATYDIDGSMIIDDYVGLGYDDQCFALRVTFAESHFTDRDIQPEQSVMLTFTLKSIGSARLTQQVGGEDTLDDGLGPIGSIWDEAGAAL